MTWTSILEAITVSESVQFLALVCLAITWQDALLLLVFKAKMYPKIMMCVKGD